VCAGRFDALCLDVDNAPEWTVAEGNSHLYFDAGLTRLAALLKPGGVVGRVERGAAPAFAARLRALFGNVCRSQSGSPTR
jgi:hypothetical protein